MFRMGYSAATGGIITEIEPLFLGATLFLWQFPHFFALNWMYREDCEFLCVVLLKFMLVFVE